MDRDDCGTILGIIFIIVLLNAIFDISSIKSKVVDIQHDVEIIKLAKCYGETTNKEVNND